MNGKFKILLLTVFFSLISTLSFAQVGGGSGNIELNGFVYEPGKVTLNSSSWCSVTGVYLNTADYQFNGTSYDSYVFISYEYLIYDKSNVDEWTDITEEADELGLFSMETTPKSGKIGSTARLKKFQVTPSRIDPSWSGKTIKVRLYFKANKQDTGIYEEIDLEIPGTVEVVNGVPEAHYQIEPLVDEDYNGTPEAYVIYLCEGDVLNMKINNKEVDPYGKDISYYDNTYVASYIWQREYYDLSTLDFTVEPSYETGISFSEDDLATGTSKMYYYKPTISVSKFDALGNELVGQGCQSVMTPYIVVYNSPIKQNFYLNAVNTTNAVICNGDEFIASFDLLKDDMAYESVLIDLYATDPETGIETMVTSINGFDEFLEYNFGELYAINGKNTFYNYRAVVYDLYGDVWDQDENGEWNIFTRERHCPVEFAFSVEVKEMDAKITVDAPSEVCMDSDLELKASVTGYGSVSEGNYYTYEWRCDYSIVPENNVNELTLVDKGIPYSNGLRTYNFVVINNGCEVVSEPVEVKVNKRPIVTAESDKYSTCKNAEVTMSVTCDEDDVTYTWTPSDGILSSDGSSMTVNTSLAPLAVGTYEYAITAQNNKTGCTTRDPEIIKVIINGQPEIVSVSPASPTVCEGGSILITASLSDDYVKATPITYEWKWTDNGVEHTETNTIGQLTMTPSETVNVSVSAVDNNGCESSAPYQFTVTVNKKPLFSLEGTDGCDGGTISIECKSEDGLSHEYFVTPISGAPAGTLSGGVYTVNLSPASLSSSIVYEYSVRAVSGLGCEDTKTIKLTVNPLPSATLKSDKSTYCMGETVQFTVTDPQSNFEYSWDGGVSYTANTKFIGTATTEGNQVFTVYVRNKETGCVNTAQVTFAVKALPEVTITASDSEICEGSSTTLTANANTDVTYEWSNGETSSMINTGDLTANKTFTVIVTDKLTSCSAEVSHEVVVNKKPKFTIVAEPAEVCNGETQTVEFTTSVTNGVDVASYVWSDAAIVASGGSYSITKTWTSSETFEVTATSDKGCVSMPVTVAVKVNELPVVTLSADQTDLKYCEGESITFTATASNVQYCWDGTKTNWVDNNKFTKNVTSGETFVVYVKDKTTGCINSASVTYEVNNLPVVSITPSETTICEGDNVVLSATDNSNFEYEWSTGETTKDITVSPLSETIYTVTILDKSTTCSIEAESVVKVNKKPVFTVIAEPQNVCVGETSTVKFTVVNENGVPVSSYVWNDTDVSGSGDSYSVNRTWNTVGNVVFQVVANSSLTPSCESDPVEVSIYVHPLLELNEPIASPARICKDSGNEVTLSASVVSGTNVEYEWFEGTTSIGKGSSIKVNPIITTTYSVVARDLSTSANCESAEKTVTVYVDDAPAKPVVAVSNNTYCSNETIAPELQIVSPSSDLAYKWYTSEGVYVGEGSTLSVTPTKTTSYYATATLILSSGCESEKSDLVEVVINQAPIIKDVFGIAGVTPVRVCEKGGIFLMVSSKTPNMEFTWTPDAITGMSPVTSNDSVYMGNPIESGYIVVYATDAAGCRSNEVKYELLVDKLPVVTVEPVNPNVCQGEAVTIEIKTDRPASDVLISWEQKNKDASSWSAMSTSNPSKHTFVPEKDMLYRVYVTDLIIGCITDAIDIPITMIDALEIELSNVNGGGQYCKDNDMSITASIANSGSYTYTYEWYYQGTKIADGATLNKSSLQISDAGVYTVKVKCNETGCVGELSQEIIVRDKIEVHIDDSYLNNMICFGQPLNVSIREEGTDYRWFVDGVEMTGEKSSTLEYSTAGMVPGTQIKVKQILTSSTGCPSDEVEETYTILGDFSASFVVDGDDKVCEDEEVKYVIDVENIAENQDCYNNIIKKNCAECSFTNVSSYELFVNGVGLGAVNKEFGIESIPYTATGMDDFSIYAQVKNVYGCEYTTPKIDIKVSNVSVDDVISESGATSYCVGMTDKIKVVASGAINDNYNYEFIVNGTSVQSSSSNELQVDFSIVGTTEIKVIVTDVDATCVSEKIVSYLVNDLPQAELYVNGSLYADGSTYSVCDGELIDLNIAGSDFVVEIDGVEVFGVEYHSTPGVATITPSDIDLSSFFANKSDIDISDLTKLSLALIGDYDGGDRTIRVKVTDPETGCHKWSNSVTLHWMDEITLSVPYPHEINTKLQLCLGESTTITASAADVTSFTFIPESGTPIVGTSYDIIASAIGTYMLTIQTEFGCEKNVEIEVVNAPDPKVEIWTFNGTDWIESVVGADGYYSICGSVPTKLIAKGASAYNMNILRDGESVVADMAYTGDQFEYDFDSKFDLASAGMSDYNDYEIRYDMSVGTCEDATSVKLKVYRLPDAKLTVTPGNTIINGTPVTIEVTSGYSQYDFYLNETLAQSGTESSYTSSIAETSAIRVEVFNTFGCSIDLVDTVSVLEGIAPKDVLQSSDYYCDDTEGVTISINDPQIGITYKIVELEDVEPIKAESGKAVEWTNVKILSGINPTTYSVIAYHEALPMETVPMLNTVTVREVKVPNATRLLPYNSYVDVCNNGDVLQIESSEVGVQYLLFHEDSEGNVTEVLRLEGNGGTLDLMSPNKKGKYSAIAYGINGDVVNLVCPVVVDGTYEYDIPEFELYTLSSNPSNGNICVGSNGAQLTLSGSESGRMYSVYKDGSLYTDITTVEGTGNPIVFGEVYESGVYTVVCDYNGCSQTMNGSIVVTLYDKPKDFEVSVSDNGYFCENESSVKISVSGQQESYVYRLMGYIDPENALSVSEIETYIGDNSNAAFTFTTDIVTAGKYFVVVDIPNFEESYGACSTVLKDGAGVEFVDVKSVSIKKPTIKVAKYEADEYITERLDNIVVCENDYVDIVVGQTEDKTESQSIVYSLYCNDVLVDSRIDESMDDNYVVFKKQPVTSTVGKYKYHVVAEKTIIVDGNIMKTCAVDYAGSVESVVEIIARPADRTDGLTEHISVNVPVPVPGVCDPASIIVDNAQVGKVYRLYRILSPGGDIITSSAIRKVAESNQVVFNVEGQDDWYVVSVSNEMEIDGEMVKLCEDFLTPEQHVVDDRFLENHKIDLPSYVCHGDVVTIRMESSQVGVTYTLYKKTNEDANGRPIGDVIGFKTAENTSGFVFNETITEDGIYFVEASGLDKCNTLMDNEFRIKFNNLPISYELKPESAPGKRDDVKTYCVADSGVYVYLENSQDNVIYTLFNIKDDGSLVFVESKEGDSGNEVQFNTKLVDENADAEGVSTYIVSARNKLTNCTSSMKGRIEVLYMPEINTSLEFEPVELNNCMPEYVMTLPSAELMTSAIYTLVSVDTDGSRVVLDSEYAQESTDIAFAISKAGVYELYGSYEQAACEKLIDTLIVKEFFIETQNFVYNHECDGFYRLALDNSQSNVEYILNVRDTEGGVVALDTVSGFDGIGIKFEADTLGENYDKFFVEAKHGDCILTFDDLNVSDLEIYNTIGIADVFQKTDSICFDGVIDASMSFVWAVGANYSWRVDGVEIDSYTPTSDTVVYTFKYDATKPGLYELVASYNGKCSTVVAQRTLFVDNVTTYAVSGSVTCDGLATISISGSDIGVQYTLMGDTDTLETWIGNGYAYDFIVTPDVMYNEFYVVAKTQFGCELEMSGRVQNTKPADIKVEAFDPIDEFVCDNASYPFIIQNPQIGVTYYVVPDSVKKPSELTPLYQVKAEAETPIEFNLFAGSYSVWASYDNFDCLTERWGVIKISSMSYNYYDLTSNQEGNCEVGAGLILTYSGSQDGVTYQLISNNHLVADTTVVGGGYPLTFEVNGEGVVTYILKANVQGECEAFLDEITVDFDHVIAPIASLELFIEGEKWESTDTAEICPESFTSIVADIRNVAISEYYFYFNGVKYDRANAISNTLTPVFSVNDSIVEIKLEVLTQSGCLFSDVDSLVVKISNGVLDGTPLIAENNYPEYCEGEVGVRLAYLLPRKGEVYRLYKVGEFEDELLDIQEIPHYWIGATKDTLWLSGWGDEFTTDYKAYAKAGEYYVTVEGEDGCTKQSNHLFVTENPLPVTDKSQVYFAHTYKNAIDEWEVDTTTISTEYGLLDTGHLILEDAQPGVTYTLYHIETEAELQVKKATFSGQTLLFGPIINYKEPEVEEDTVVVDPILPMDSTITVPADSSILTPTDSVSVVGRFNKSTLSAAPEDWGEGIYTIIATNDTTGCTTEIGSVEFVEEQLVAYDVYLFMNKTQSIIKQSLYPKYPNKGNHKFIDWSSKVDVVWSPKVDQSADGTYTIVEDETMEEYEKNSGYSKEQSKANIVFELLPTMKDSIFTVFDTIRSETPIVGGDSVYVYSSYEYFKIDSIGFDTITNTQIDTTFFYPTFVEGCDSIETQHFSYFKVDNYTDTAKVLAGTWGRYGFDSFTGSQDYDLASMSGMFVYAKRPSFYGQEVLRYRIYNKKMASVRFSNEAKITILCGNQDTGDSATVFLMPNAISPNGDGLNDVFKILLPYNYSDSESKLEVFNRWGTLVYRSSGTQYGGDCYGGLTPVDPVNIWDGTSRTSNMLTVGENLPSGTYFYVYTITLVDNNGSHKTKKLSGYVELRH